MKITKSYLKQIIKEELAQATGDYHSKILQQQKVKRKLEENSEYLLEADDELSGPTNFGPMNSQSNDELSGPTNFGPMKSTAAVTSFGPANSSAAKAKPAQQKGGKSKTVVLNIKKQLTQLISQIDKVLGQM